jgi:hypothetical protein
MNKNISYNRTAIVNQNGTVSSMTISRAFSIGMIVDNLDTTFLGEENDRPNYFYVIPLTEGTIKVRLVGGREDYTISEAEITANLGLPIPYLVETVYRDGTTAQFNIGW